MSIATIVSAALNIVDRARRRVGLANCHLDASPVVVEPPGLLRYKPSRFLEGQFDRIVAFEERTTPAIEHNRHFGGPRPKPSLTAYRLRNAIINMGTILTGRSSVRIAPYSGYDFPAAQNEFRQFKTGAFCSTMLGLQYFGHWMSEDCPLFHLAAEFGDPVGFPLNSWPHKDFYRDRFAVEPDSADIALIKELFLFDDQGFGPSKIRRLSGMRDKIASHFEASSASKVVYLSRGNTGNPRNMMAEEDFIEQLNSRGIEVLRVQQASGEDICKALRSARLLITIEGSHGAPALCALPAGSGLLELVPPERFCTRHKEWADAVGIHYGFLVGIKREQGFTFPLEDVLRAIDLML